MITIKVVFFASFKERLGCSSINCSIDQKSSIETVCSFLAQKGGPWKELFTSPCQSVKIACNQQIVELGFCLKDGDEVAFFPPVTGG
jgi:molybdopterin synthase sulfur carrier subunit